MADHKGPRPESGIARVKPKRVPSDSDSLTTRNPEPRASAPVDRIPLGVIEAKNEGTTLSMVADQFGLYGDNLPDFLAALLPGTKKIPFPDCLFDITQRWVSLCSIISPVVSTPGAGPSKGGPCLFLEP